MNTASIKSNVVPIEQLGRVTAFVAENTRVKGDFEAEPETDVGLKIDGTVDGSVRVPSGGVVHIGPTGRVKGPTIEADYVFVEGRVDSKIIARKGVELTATACVMGRVEYFESMFMHGLSKVRGDVHYAGEGDLA